MKYPHLDVIAILSKTGGISTSSLPGLAGSLQYKVSDFSLFRLLEVFFAKRMLIKGLASQRMMDVHYNAAYTNDFIDFSKFFGVYSAHGVLSVVANESDAFASRMLEYRSKVPVHGLAEPDFFRVYSAHGVLYVNPFWVVANRSDAFASRMLDYLSKVLYMDWQNHVQE
ncbi:hypothetical protein FF38_06016 [Lucilia cuprina]|uniref:Uncharacterized protein n=1 Tax=Lucilia cuprina TaxID=7375 RepID=A0A0L0C861_LUCCU|nr:hypothetical protein FF38_06016 [Lucilia cuprina]